MWDRPDLLNRAANVLFTAAGFVIAWALVWFVVHLPVFALRSVEVTGDARHITQTQVEGIVADLKGTFFTIDLEHVRRSFEKLPWVREVKLRRHWPDKLEVSVTEQVPLARWGNSALVNVEGDVFRAAYDGRLPVFGGPEGTSREVTIQYEFFRRNLAPLGVKPVHVHLTARGAWRVKLDSGTTLELGRDDIEGRLARYIALHERTVGALKRRIDYVDLRYANGFAVRIPELKGEPMQEKGQPKQQRRTRRT